MNCWNSILTISNVRKLSWSLKPSFLKMIVKYSFSISIHYSSAEYIGSELRLRFSRRESKSFECFEMLKSGRRYSQMKIIFSKVQDFRWRHCIFCKWLNFRIGIILIRLSVRQLILIFFIIWFL